MSALPPKADSKPPLQNVRFGPKADILDGQIAALFDYLVDAGKARSRHGEAERQEGGPDKLETNRSPSVRLCHRFERPVSVAVGRRYQWAGKDCPANGRGCKAHAQRWRFLLHHQVARATAALTPLLNIELADHGTLG